MGQSHLPPVMVVEDQSDDRKQLTTALRASLPRDVEILDFESPHLADKEVGYALGTDGALPLVLIADLDMEGWWGNGFLVDQRNIIEKKTGRSLWTILVSRHDQRKIGAHNDTVPTTWIRKTEPDWAAKCAETITPLYANTLSSDGDSNDFGPTRPTAAFDRFYFYESGTAMRSSSDPRDGGFRDSFPFGLVQPLHQELRDSEQPIFMHRARYLPIEGQSLKLVRILLRWRTVARVRRRPFWICEMTSFDDSGFCEGSASSPGIPVPSAQNVIGRLRRTSRVASIIRAALALTEIDGTLPALPRSDRTTPTRVFELPQDGRVDGFGPVAKGWHEKGACVVPCPTDFQSPAGQPDEDGFFSRLQFVCSPAEVLNYQMWKQRWIAAEWRWKELPDVPS